MSATLGPAFPHLGWVPAPRYLLRRARILHQMQDLPPGRLLEVGPGAGALLTELAARGFQCEALELSQDARILAQAVLRSEHLDIPVHDDFSPAWKERFDYVVAFDVLEHVKFDREALARWISWLRPGGVLLLSVPAHMKLWTAGDEWAGHFRRYERDDLVALLAAEGVVLDAFECYGFPLSNLTEKVSARSYRKLTHKGGEKANDQRKNNDRSGIDRRPHLRLYPIIKSLPGRLAMRAACFTQSLFLKADLGSGYLVRAHRVDKGPV